METRLREKQGARLITRGAGVAVGVPSRSPDNCHEHAGGGPGGLAVRSAGIRFRSGQTKRDGGRGELSLGFDSRSPMISRSQLPRNGVPKKSATGCSTTSTWLAEK